MPTPEECGRKILAICGRFNVGSNEMVRFGSLHSAFLDDGCRAADFGTAVRWLEAQGLIDTKGIRVDDPELGQDGQNFVWDRRHGARTPMHHYPLKTLIFIFAL